MEDNYKDQILPPDLEVALIKSLTQWLKVVGALFLAVTIGAWGIIYLGLTATAKSAAEAEATGTLQRLDERLERTFSLASDQSEKAQQLVFDMSASLGRTQSLSEAAERLSFKASTQAASVINKINEIEQAAANIPRINDINEISNQIASSEIVKNLINESVKLAVTSTSEVPVGTIISSIIPPEEFISINPKYHLADGGAVDPTSKYGLLYYKSALPDLRGVFLRGQNRGRSDKYADPDNSRLPGSLQNHNVGKHNHNITLVKNGWPDSSGDRTRDGSSYYLLDPSQSGSRGKITTDIGGGLETRPNNISVFYYIKVN